ncbi:MAG: DUF4256 domain-containing protein [Candidatus Gracilibacteria bacterium]
MPESEVIPQAPDGDDIHAESVEPDIPAKAEAVPVNPGLLQKIISETEAETAENAIELSPEHAQTLSTLKSNQESKEDRLKTDLEWGEVEAKLRKSPEKLNVLARLIARGGEPTVTARLSNDKFRFDELSPESPTGDRDIDFDRAEQIATELGAELTEPTVYDSFQPKGIVLDKNTWSWLRTTKEVRRTDSASQGKLGRSDETNPNNHSRHGGLRCSLEV